MLRLGRARTGSVILAGALVGAIVAMSGPGAGHADAAHVNCGDTITTSTRLHSNLENCPNNGIIIGADDVTLNLNAHTIEGDGKVVHTCPPDEACDVGIDVAGHTGVRIRSGNVRGFGLGILAVRARHIHLQLLSVMHNRFSGIVVAESTGARLWMLDAFANGLKTDQAGIGLFGVNHLALTDSTLRGNGDIGLYVEDLNHSRLAENVFKRNPEAGAILDGDQNLVAHNRFARNGDGLVVGGNRNVVRGNRIKHATGCHPGCGMGISLESGQDNLIARNRVRGAHKLGIRVASYGPIANTLVRRNHIFGAGKDGLAIRRVMAAVELTQIRRNRVIGATDDGIDVGSRDATLTANSAQRNGDLGIDAKRGVTDGGENSAQRNGDPRECVNVVCAG